MVRVLQVGRMDLSQEYLLPEGSEWVFCTPQEVVPRFGEEGKEEHFEAVLIETLPPKEACECLFHLASPYTFFYTEGALPEGEKMPDCLKQRMIRRIRRETLQGFCANLTRYFHDHHLGTKLAPQDIQVSTSFSGRAAFDGNRGLYLKGEYGKGFTPLLSWRSGIYCDANMAQDLWLEYDHEPGVELELVVRSFAPGLEVMPTNTQRFFEKEMAKPVRVSAGRENTSFSLSLHARGEGRLRIGALHYRFSRYGAGYFLPGGSASYGKGRQEIFSYFDPADAKPPLNVYFSGYRTAEGFEGLGMMQSLGAPFLLLSDPRLSGGCFYEGDESLKAAVEQEIKSALDTLGFTGKECILSGLSMGTYGAVYYGATLQPYAIIIGKPLLNLGTVAAGETLLRPGGFPTSLDVLRSLTGGLSDRHVQALNARLWDRVEKADYSETEFAVAYMESDDYDPTAYQDLLKALQPLGARIVGKGIPGRHNDNTAQVVEWFLSQYKRVLREGFGRVQVIRR